jgi:flavin reductase
LRAFPNFEKNMAETFSQEPANPATISSDDFKRGMRRLASGVVIIASEYQGQRFGLAATAVTSISAEPATLMVCVNRKASAYQAISSARCYTVNILHEDDRGIADLFSQPHTREQRFRSGKWSSLVTGAPVLEGSLASFDCRLTQSFEASSHTLFLGEVVDLRLLNDELRPLVYWNGAYRGGEAGREA